MAYMTSREVSHLLRISTSTLWRWVRQGHLPRPYYVAPSSPRWDMAELSALVKKRRLPAQKTGSRKNGG